MNGLIAVTGGDPCGIGPEVILKALAAFPSTSRAPLVVIGDHAVFEETARRLHRRLPPWPVIHPQDPWPLREPLVFLDCSHPATFTPGRSSGEAGAASLIYVDHAIALWRAKRLRALVTAPVTKWAIGRSQPSFVGQTEYLAGAMGAREVVMMFVSDRLRVALLTRHVPLARVSRSITREGLRRALRLTAAALETRFKIRRPRLALCGLNPHAGEAGRCGKEERAIMAPVLQALRREGLSCEGPFAADGFFAGTPRYDAVVCPYHDQGLIPFKMLARDRGCQLSVGLPVIRTSPDHGSALDIAGRGVAHPGSMIYALRLATRLLQVKRQK